VATRSFIEAGWSTYARTDYVAEEPGRSRSLSLQTVYDLIAKICRQNVPVYDLTTIDSGTVYHYFQAWQYSGVWVHLHRVLYEQARRHAGRAACPSVVIMDGQSVKTTERGGARGFDAHKRVNGRQTPHFGRHTRPTGCQPCRSGGHIQSARGRWRIECVVSENPDDNSRLEIAITNLGMNDTGNLAA
jgi:transposase